MEREREEEASYHRLTGGCDATLEASTWLRLSLGGTAKETLLLPPLSCE